MVKSGSAKAKARGESSVVSFRVADVEQNLAFADNSIDAIISGNFDPSPHQEKAFKEIHRVLKGGGRMSLCIGIMSRSVRQIEWMCKSLGFKDLAIDYTRSVLQAGFSEEEL